MPSASHGFSSVRARFHQLHLPLSNLQTVIAPRLLKPLTTGTSICRDPLIEVIVPTLLLRKLNLISGSWAAISSTDRKCWRLCRVIVGEMSSFLSEISEEEDVWSMVPPSLAFNAGIGPFDSHVEISSIYHSQIKPDASFLKNNFSPILASEALIARVQTCIPNQDTDIFYMKQSHEMITLALSVYMSTPRILSLNDVFGVSFPKIGICWNVLEATELDFNEAIHSFGSELVWFKVLSLTPANIEINPSHSILPYFVSETAVVVRHGTTLMQSKAVPSRVPNVHLCHGFTCKIVKYPTPSTVLPIDNVMVKKITEFLAPIIFQDLDQSDSLRFGVLPSLILHGAVGVGKTSSVFYVAAILGVHVQVVSALAIIESTEVFTSALDQALQCSPCILLIRGLTGAGTSTRGGGNSDDIDQNVASVMNLALNSPNFQGKRAKVILAATCESLERVPTVQLRCFTHTIEVQLPSQELRFSLLKYYLKGYNCEDFVDEKLNEIAKSTVGRTARDLECLVCNAVARFHERVFQEKMGSDDCLKIFESQALIGEFSNPFDQGSNSISLSFTDLKAGELSLLPPNTGLSISKQAIPNVKWDDIGGLSEVKNEIIDIIELPLKYPEIFSAGVKRRAGILLYGPPGTGKTLLAKAVASECGLTFFSVKGPELLDMYVGESERNVRNVFKNARNASPCVLFFDELDSLAPQRGRGSDSGGVMDRVVAQLLSELDGVCDSKEGKTVFVIGATNRPDLLDPSLLRPGRFDRLLYLGTGGDDSTKIKVLRAATRKFEFEADVDLEEISQKISSMFTGADVSAVASTALMIALKRKISQVDDEAENLGVSVTHVLNDMNDDELSVKVSKNDLEEAAASIRPSVSLDELDHYEKLRLKFSSNVNALEKSIIHV